MRLFGQYAFEVSGYGTALAGSITANGSGQITGGVEDIAAPAGSASDLSITGTYTVGSDNRGTLIYTDSNGNTFTFAIALGDVSTGVAQQGQMIEFDSNPYEMTGQLALQSPATFSTSALFGAYAFDLPGWDLSTPPVQPQVVIGSFTAGAGSVTSGLFDENDAGSVTAATPFTGSIGSIDSNGRGTFTINTGSNTQTATLYVVSASEWFLITGNSNTQEFVSAGEVMAQLAGPFGTTSLDGTTIFVDQSETGMPSPHAVLGLATFPGNGSVSFSLDINDGGTVSQLTTTGTYSFTNAANGRFTLTPSGANTVVGYMVAPNEAILTDATSGQNPDFGTLEQQASGPFSNSTVNGSFYLGTLPLMSPGAPPSSPGNPPPALNITSGIAAFDGAGGLTSTVDVNSSGVPSSGLTGSDTYSIDATGRITTTSGDLVGYIGSLNKLYLLNIAPGQPDSPNPTIFIICSTGGIGAPCN
ncbi:MAG: hypothetical protein ACRESE_07155 [Gammaproteobacteria bacterium]